MRRASRKILIKAVKSDGQSLHTWRARETHRRNGGLSRRGLDEYYPRFHWPLEVGAVARPGSFSPAARCGDGLHGFSVSDGERQHWNQGSYYPKDRWIVFLGHNCIRIDHAYEGAKWKCEWAEVLFVGTLPEAIAFVRQRTRRPTPLHATGLLNFLRSPVAVYGLDRLKGTRVLLHLSRLRRELFPDSYEVRAIRL
jgi:hypothetical protein